MKEINLIGGFYRSKTLPWSAQDVVNWAPVPSRSGGTRSPLKLRGLPGLSPLPVTFPPPPVFKFVVAKTASAAFSITEDFDTYIGPFIRSPTPALPAFGEADYVGGFAIFGVSETRTERAPLGDFDGNVTSAVLSIDGTGRKIRRFTPLSAGTAKWTTIDGGQTLVPIIKPVSGSSGPAIDICRLATGRWLLLLAPEGGPSELMFSDAAQPGSADDWATLAVLPASVSNASAILTDGERLVVSGFDASAATQGIAVSTNGGLTWTQHSLPGVSSNRTPRVGGGVYANGAFLVDTESNTLPGQLHRSTTGTSWTTVLSFTDPVFGVGGSFDSLTTGGELIICTAQNSIYTSTDGGISWESRTPPGNPDSGEIYCFYAGDIGIGP